MIDITLDPGEVICDECNGEGIRFIQITTGYKTTTRKAFCKKCDGTRKIDWIQKLTNSPKSKKQKGFPGEIVWSHSGMSNEKKEVFIEEPTKEFLEELENRIIDNILR